MSHVGGLPELEDEMVLMTGGGFQGEGSPNRVDALVWALSEVMLSHQKPDPLSSPVSIPKMAGSFRR